MFCDVSKKLLKIGIAGEYFKKAGENCNAGAMRTNQSCAGVSSWMRESRQLCSVRSHFTTFGKDESECEYVNGGVPQGSKVGPIAFIIKISQLPSSLGGDKR